jgi:hypothetical protein
MRRLLLVLVLLCGALATLGGSALAGGWDPDPTAACDNMIDDDGDGHIDSADLGCHMGASDPYNDYDEYNPPDADWDFNIGDLDDAIGDPFEDFAILATSGCRSPVVRQEYKGRTGFHHWTIFQRVNFCWNSGRITSFNRERWIWKTENPLSGWEWKGWIGTNCNLETCPGRGVGTTTTSAWTQGQWKFCSLKWVLCHEVTPLIGIRVFGTGAVRYFHGVPQ